MATLAITGIPGFSGFFSKDEILWQAFSSAHGHRYLWAVGAAAAGLTAFYMFRLFFVTFLGRCRASEEVKKHIHESPPIMTIPLMVLAVLSVIGGYIGIPHILGGRNFFHEFLAPVLGGAPEGTGETAFFLIRPVFASSSVVEGSGVNMELLLMKVSVAIALIGILVAFYLYIWKTDVPQRLAKRFNIIYTLVFNKYYVDEIYEFLFVNSTKRLGTFLWRRFDEGVVDRGVNLVAALMGWLGSILRRIQTGSVQNYALGIILGAVIIIIFLIR
jgi:NADH-quinone oxidoreductase subunit L